MPGEGGPDDDAAELLVLATAGDGPADRLRVGEAQPQIVVRVGWPAESAAELPVTPRRDLRSVLLPS